MAPVAEVDVEGMLDYGAWPAQSGPWSRSMLERLSCLASEDSIVPVAVGMVLAVAADIVPVVEAVETAHTMVVTELVHVVTVVLTPEAALEQAPLVWAKRAEP